MVFFDASKSRRAIVWIALFLCTVITLCLSCSAVVYLEERARTFAQATTTRPNFDNPAFEKTIALTFDDGPDATYTIPIAKFLESHNVPATFFVIGEHVLRHPAITRTLVEKGFELGNHSFSHSRAVHASPERIRKELTATDLALIYATGHSTALYRPPFLLDVGFGVIDGHAVQSEALRTVERIGPTVVSADIDTTDWEKESIYEENEIYRILVAGVRTGKHVVLLHDHGGEGATLEALKQFVPEMLREGYTFVPVSYYYGLSSTEVMPPAELTPILYGVVIFLYIVATNALLTGALGCLAVLSLMRIFFILGSARTLPQTTIAHTNPTSRNFAVIVPAYNEEANIRATLQSITRSTLLPSRVFVVDDGSTDDTASIVRMYESAAPYPIILLQKPNGGTKAAALQYAMKEVIEEVVVCIDADTIIESHAFRMMLGHFEDSSVGAVAGKVYPATTKTWVEKLQYLEYVQGQNLEKHVFAFWNSVGIVPGAIGAWRTRALNESGGYSTDTVVEDQDLTLALLAHGWAVRYEPRAIAHTETPSTLSAFYNQRRRWVYGTLQCFYKYDQWFLSPQQPWLGLIVLPNILFFNIIFPLAAPFIDIIAVLGIFGYANAPIIAASFVIFVVLDVWLAWEGVRHERNPRYSLLLWIPVQRMVYHYVSAVAVLKSIFSALSGSMIRWGKLSRRGAAAEALSEARPAEDIVEFVPQAYL